MAAEACSRAGQRNRAMPALAPGAAVGHLGVRAGHTMSRGPEELSSWETSGGRKGLMRKDGGWW